MNKPGKLKHWYLFKNMTAQVSSAVIFNKIVKAETVKGIRKEFMARKEVKIEKFAEFVSKIYENGGKELNSQVYCILSPGRVNVHKYERKRGSSGKKSSGKGGISKDTLRAVYNESQH